MGPMETVGVARWGPIGKRECESAKVGPRITLSPSYPSLVVLSRREGVVVVGLCK